MILDCVVSGMLWSYEFDTKAIYASSLSKAFNVDKCVDVTIGDAKLYKEEMMKQVISLTEKADRVLKCGVQNSERFWQGEREGSVSMLNPK